MRQSSTEEDLWSIFVQQHMGLTCLVIKRPWCVPFCLTEEEKAAHAYIMGVGGELFWDYFFFLFWTVRFICLLVENRCESLTMAALQHPFTLHSLFFCPDLLSLHPDSDSPPLLPVFISLFYPVSFHSNVSLFSHYSNNKNKNLPPPLYSL